MITKQDIEDYKQVSKPFDYDTERGQLIKNDNSFIVDINWFPKWYLQTVKQQNETKS